MGDDVLYEKQGQVALISLNRPASLNAFTTELLGELVHAFERAEHDADIRVVVLTGEGRAFSAGADLKRGLEGQRSISDRLQYEYRPVLEAIARIPKPVISAVPGFAAGIGLSIAMHADLMVMAEDAFLLSPFTTISLVPDGGANWLLVRQLGYRRAYQLSIESERVSASQCLEFGIANKVVPAAELREAAMAWARKLCKRAPLSLAATKKVMRHAMDNDWASCFDIEAGLQAALRDSEDAMEGINAFFEKREPDFKGK
jgi:2-(1,2-epoxy-1,2-dihydrophenyl)acetyl-CoA isomerase